MLMRSNFLKPAAQEKSTPRKRPCITSPQRAPIGRNPAKKLKGLTEEEWSAYFRGLSVVKLGLKGGKIDPHVRQSINGKPLVAIPIIFRASLLSRHYTQLFTLIDYVSVPICAEVVKAMSCCKKMHIPQAVEAKIRQTVNASAESQLEAIQYPLLEEFFGDLQSLECIYEWVKQGKYMDSLPKRFATPEVVVELVRLGNAKVFRWFRNKTLELCMAVLKIDHTCIKWIGGDLQTKEMSDYVLSRSVDNYAYLANHLKTIDNSWKALNHNLEMFSLIPDNSTSRGMVKYVIQNFNSSINKYLEKKLIHEGNYVGDLSLSRKLGRCLVANADLAWYVIEKNPELIAELSLHLWMPFDALMLEHICKHCSQRVIQACYPNMLDSPTFRENIPTLIMRDPHSISFFAGEIKITEEMSVCAMEAAPKQLFRHCTLTPKVLKMACEADMDLFDSIKGRRCIISDMMLSCEELIPLNGKYVLDLISSKTINFKMCANLIQKFKFTHHQELYDVLGRLENSVLKLCFRTACFYPDITLRPSWKENVDALGRVESFDVKTMVLVVSFMGKDEANTIPSTS